MVIKALCQGISHTYIILDNTLISDKTSLVFCLLPQKIDDRKLSSGYKIIDKPHPVEPLKIKNLFLLSANLDTAVISPKVRFLVTVEKIIYAEIETS